MPPLFQIRWQPRTEPLAPLAVAVQGAAATMLARRLLDRSADDLASLRGVSAPALLIVSGPGVLLPWAEGALYLGQDPSAPHLLLPTTLAPSAPTALMERALRAAFPAVLPPIAVLMPWNRLVSLQQARAIEAECLREWLAGKG
jgi:hypothetical protein